LDCFADARKDDPTKALRHFDERSDEATEAKHSVARRSQYRMFIFILFICLFLFMYYMFFWIASLRLAKATQQRQCVIARNEMTKQSRIINYYSQLSTEFAMPILIMIFKIRFFFLILPII
jgi:hypothetical protein